MSTRPEFVQYLLDQLEGLGELRARKMFGDYLVYLNDRPALLVCDGTPFAKPLPCVAELLKDRPTAPPYEGAKAHYVLDPEDRDTLRRAAELGYNALFLVGDPEYYGRYGFRNAVSLGFQNASGVPDPFLLARSLNPDGFQEAGGMLNLH